MPTHKTSVEPICSMCIHLHHDKPGLTCSAFPNGIPTTIARGENLHLERVRGDNGIRFALDPVYKEAAEAGVRAGAIPKEVLTSSEP